MRFPAILLALVCTLVAPTQGQPNRLLFLTVRTDVTVLIHKHPTGADMVEITMRDPNYPLDLLAKQANRICGGPIAPARGLTVAKESVDGSTDPKFLFVKATFATNGIIDTQNNVLRIEPIVRAFAGTPAPYTINGITIDFENVKPSKTVLQRYSVPGIIDAEGRFSDEPPLVGLEYRIALLTQDPDKIVFPDKYVPPKAQGPGAAAARSTRSWLVAVVFAVAALGAGALVYFAVLRSGSRRRA